MKALKVLWWKVRFFLVFYDESEYGFWDSLDITNAIVEDEPSIVLSNPMPIALEEAR